MTDRPEPRGRRAPWWGWLLALLWLPLAAAESVAAPPVAAALAATPTVLGACYAAISPTTIIQIALVIGGIAIFWLSRSTR